MRGGMNVDRIRAAVRARLDELERRDPKLTLTAIADRMGSTTKTLENLRLDRPKTGFKLGTLRNASRALEWPEDALELVESGEVAAADLPDVPWESDELDPDRVAAEQRTLRAEVDGLRGEVHQLRGEIATLRKLVVEALGLPREDAPERDR